MIAWVSLLALLVLANTYFTNTNWDRAWIVGPTKYNISALLEGGNDDDFDDVQNNNDDGKGKEAKAAKAQNVDEESGKEGKNKNVPTIDAEDGSGNAKAAKVRV